MKTVIALYDRFEIAQHAVHDLHEAGFLGDDINLIARDAQGEFERSLQNEDLADGAATGARHGAVIGGLGGILVGLGALAIPGIGPVLAAGPLVAALAGAGVGAVVGGVVGALIDLGIPDEHAEAYAEGVRRGGTLVTVEVDDMRADLAATILSRHDPVDMNRAVENWRMANWSGFDASAAPLAGEQLEYNRMQVESDQAASGGSTVMDVNDTKDVPATGTPALDKSNDVIEQDASTIPLTGATADNPYVLEGALDMLDVEMERAFVERGSEWIGHYQANFAASGSDYPFYEPAYRLGFLLGQDPHSRPYDWAHLEPYARQQWLRHAYPGDWEQVRAAVRHAWELIRNA